MASDLGSDQQLWDALANVQFALALSLIDRSRLSWTTRDWRNNGTRGNILMGLRRFEEAAVELALANELAYTRDPRDHLLVFGREEGAALWLAGQRDRAAAKWKEVVEALISGRKTMDDFAGGVGPCMLLWFAGVTLPDVSLSKLAQKQLRKLSRRSKIGSWPGPLAAIALETANAEKVFAQYCESSGVKHSLQRQADGYLDRRRLSQLFFYWGVERRSQGDTAGCRALMKSSSLQNVWIVAEWYLARAEAEQLQ